MNAIDNFNDDDDVTQYYVILKLGLIFHVSFEVKKFITHIKTIEGRKSTA